jgi:hypothetical protein
VKLPAEGACGRDQTPYDRAIGYTCIRPRHHSGPCAMVFVRDEPLTPAEAVPPNVRRLLVLLVLGLLAVAAFWWLLGTHLLAAGPQLPADYTLTAFAKVRTHANSCVQGRVTYVRRQEDGDWHITLDDGAGRLLVAEVIPQLPIAPPRKGQRVLACGISRHDDRHGWDELHPVTVPFEVLP